MVAVVDVVGNVIMGVVILGGYLFAGFWILELVAEWRDDRRRAAKARSAVASGAPALDWLTYVYTGWSEPCDESKMISHDS